MIRSRASRNLRPRRKFNAEKLRERTLNSASRGARNLIAEALEAGIEIDVLTLTRSGSKGNVVKQDVQAFLDSYESDPEEE